MKKKYEYKIERPDLWDEVDVPKGWEVVSHSELNLQRSPFFKFYKTLLLRRRINPERSLPRRCG